MRFQKSLRNISVSLISQGAILLISFISRIVFVKILSEEYLGLNSLFSDILSMLSLVELGIGQAIIFSLYKPLADEDTLKINSLMNFYRMAYQTIGILVAIFGICLIPFLPLIISSQTFSTRFLNIVFVLFLTNSSLSYFFSYKRSLIMADQKQYIVILYHSAFYFVLNICQIAALIITRNFLLFLLLQILSTLLENLVISQKANKLYPFLVTKEKVPLDTITKHQIYKNTSAMLLHKIGGIVVNSTASMIISSFVSLIAVGLRSNYLLIINALNMVIAQMFDAITASVGNLGVSESKEKNLFIFNTVFMLNFWIVGFSTIALWVLINPFIEFFFGPTFLLPMTTVFILILNFYITGMRKAACTFKDALGLYWYDRYKPLFEAVINAAVALTLVHRYGIVGVLIGTTVSTLTVCFWVEPCVLYRHGFQVSSKPYFGRCALYAILLFITGTAVTFICDVLFPVASLMAFIGRMGVCATIPNIIFLGVFFRTKEFTYIFDGLKPFLNKVVTWLKRCK